MTGVRPPPPIGEHEQKLTITVDIFVPNHPDRTTSPIFRATRKKLITAESKCWIDNPHCQLDLPLELHHEHVEWCDSLGVDWERVALIAPDFDWEGFDPNVPESFIDSEWNARLVLCKRHHTGPDHGIHFLPYPDWLFQKTIKPGEIYSPDEEQATQTA